MRSGKWFGAIRRKLRTGGSSSPTFIVLQTNSTTQSPSKELAPRASDTNETAFLLQDRAGIASSSPSTRKKDGGSKEGMAAAKIQALFRAHLARRAFQALRGLVKLQALVRGVLVRKQARMALHCMHALVRLQVTVRARQLLG